MSAAYAYRRAAYTDSSDTDWNELPSVVYTVMWRFPSEWIIDSPLAYKNGKGLVLVRKKGKLPRETVEMSYDLEYGQATIEIHKDSIKPGEKVVLVDDLIATGGTIEAAAKLIESLGGIVVKMVFLIELTDLKGRERLSKYDVASVVQFEGE